jgi:hypothetical protein
MHRWRTGEGFIVKSVGDSDLVAALLCYDINQSWLTRSGLNRVVENSIKLIPVKMKKGRCLPVIFI